MLDNILNYRDAKQSAPVTNLPQLSMDNFAQFSMNDELFDCVMRQRDDGGCIALKMAIDRQDLPLVEAMLMQCLQLKLKYAQHHNNERHRQFGNLLSDTLTQLDHKKNTPLTWAVNTKNCDLFGLLLSYYRQLDDHGKVLRRAVRQPNDDGVNLIMHAICTKDTAIVDQVLDCYEQLDAHAANDGQKVEKRELIGALLHANNAGDNAMICAICAGQHTIVYTLLGKLWTKNTAQQETLETGRAQKTRNTAKPNRAQPPTTRQDLSEALVCALTHQNTGGNTPLSCAISGQNAAIAHLIVACCQHLDLIIRQPRVVAILATLLNVPNQYRQTLLMIAVTKPQSFLTNLVLKLYDKLDCNDRLLKNTLENGLLTADHYGYTPLTLARALAPAATSPSTAPRSKILTNDSTWQRITQSASSQFIMIAEYAAAKLTPEFVYAILCRQPIYPKPLEQILNHPSANQSALLSVLTQPTITPPALSEALGKALEELGGSSTLAMLADLMNALDRTLLTTMISAPKQLVDVTVMQWINGAPAPDCSATLKFC